MRIATFAILALAALGMTAKPARGWQTQPASTVAAYVVPAPEERLDPTFPEHSSRPDWNDTADTVENLDLLDSNPGVHLETDLNNDPGDPLLEDRTVEPVDDLPARLPELYPPTEPRDRDPFKDPLPR